MVSWGLVVVLLVVVVVLVVLVAEVVRVVLVVMAVVVLFHWLQNCESCYDQQRVDIMRTMMVTLKQTVNPKPFCNQTRTLQTPNPKFALTNPQSETGRRKQEGQRTWAWTAGSFRERFPRSFGTLLGKFNRG